MEHDSGLVENLHKFIGITPQTVERLAGERGPFHCSGLLVLFRETLDAIIRFEQPILHGGVEGMVERARTCVEETGGGTVVIGRFFLPAKAVAEMGNAPMAAVSRSDPASESGKGGEERNPPSL